MKISELLEGKVNKLVESDDWDDEEESPEDPEKDKVPHVVMQLRKAIDVEGNYPVRFRDGTQQKIPMDLIKKFLIKYSKYKPADRERMQDEASKSFEAFKRAAEEFSAPSAPKSIYV